MRIGTLFSGIGAPEQGAKRVYEDLEMVFACEYDKFARESFAANYDIEPEHFHIDVNDMDGKQYKDKVDIIIGGSPCQAFSIAGLREGLNDKRGQLIWQYYRIIMEASPEIFIYENVKGMVSDNNGQTLKDFEAVFRESGYFCHKAVLNTKDYGVPQNRERIYIVGFKDADLYHRFQFAPKIKLEKRLKDVLEDEVDEKYYLSDETIEGFISHKKKNDEKGYGFGWNPTEGEGIANCLDCIPDGRPNSNFIKVEGMLNIKGADQIRRVYGVDKVAATLTTMQGGNQEPKIQVIGSTGGGNEMNSRIYGTDGLSPSINAGNNGGGQSPVKHLTEENRIRKLTPRECLRLQDFPDTFKQAVSNSQQYKQAGNSMSVNILEMIFKQIEKAKAKEPTNTLFDFIA